MENQPRVILHNISRQREKISTIYRLDPAISKLGISGIYQVHATVRNEHQAIIYESQGLGCNENSAKSNAAYGIIEYLAASNQISLATKAQLKNCLHEMVIQNVRFRSGGIDNVPALVHFMSSPELSVVQWTKSRVNLILESCTIKPGSFGDSVTLTDQTLIAANSSYEDKYRGKECIVLAAPNFLNRIDEAKSASVEVRNTTWILIVRKMNSSNKIIKLCVRPSGPSACSWQSCHVHVTFKISSQNSKKKSIRLGRACKFLNQLDNEICDEFELTSEMTDQTGPYGLYGDVVFEAKLWVDVPTGIEWPSLEVSKFPGLENPGNSWHLNLNIQLFYGLTVIRNSVLHLSNKFDDPSDIVQQLQKLFYNIRHASTNVVGTRHLLNVCSDIHLIEGNPSTNTFEYLLAILESGPSPTKTAAALFESTIKRMYEETTETSSYLTLRADKITNIENALEEFFGGRAVQNVGFVNPPAILCLHLIRQSLDTHQFINMPFKYASTLKLNSFLLNDSPRKQYSLFAIQVQIKRSIHHGLIYINPNLAGKWLKCDDEYVSVADKIEAIDANTGNMQCSDPNYYKVADFLVYVADTDKDIVFPVDLPLP